MSTFYIFEGPDGAGKTTMLEKIAAAHRNAKVIHFSYPRRDEERTAEYQFSQYAEPILAETNRNNVVLLDRSWFSNICYGYIMHNQEVLSDDLSKALELMVVGAGGGTIIYCTASIETLWKRCKVRGEDHVKQRDQLYAIRTMYEKVMKQPTVLPVIRIDTGLTW